MAQIDDAHLHNAANSMAVCSGDETALVADSINDVQLRALELAVEQAIQRRNFADTFWNLGRRVQGLVKRQLEFITDLEDGEQDPATLSSLFKLDHLATRIRRNAESSRLRSEQQP